MLIETPTPAEGISTEERKREWLRYYSRNRIREHRIPTPEPGVNPYPNSYQAFLLSISL